MDSSEVKKPQGSANEEEDNALESASIDRDHKFLDKLQELVAAMKLVNVPTEYGMLTDFDKPIEDAESLIKSLEFKIAYQQSHPEEDVVLGSVKTGDTPTPLAEVFSRLGLQTHSITPHPKIIERIREDLTRRGLMDELDEMVQTELKRDIDHLEYYKAMHTRNGGNVSLASLLWVYSVDIFVKREPRAVYLLDMKLNLTKSPYIITVKDSESEKAKTTLLRGTVGISYTIFNHDSTPAGAKNRQRVRDSGDDLRKKMEELGEETTHLDQTFLSSEMYRNLFQDEYLNYFLEFKKEISPSEINSVILQCYTLMKMAGSKRTLWLLTSGMEWVFGVISVEESNKTYCYVTDIKKIETGADLRDMVLTVVYWESTRSSEVLDLYDIAQETSSIPSEALEAETD